MINLELPKNLSDLQQMIHAVAEQLLRPISRKYDKNEHDVPVELEVINRRTAGFSQCFGGYPICKCRTGIGLGLRVRLNHG